ncbi:MAG: hypothetical protein ACK56I_11690, partial [bacterium]
ARDFPSRRPRQSPSHQELLASRSQDLVSLLPFRCRLQRKTRHWLGCGVLPIELPNHPVQPLEVIQQAKLDIIHGVPDNPDRTDVSGSRDDLQQRDIQRSLAQ